MLVSCLWCQLQWLPRFPAAAGQKQGAVSDAAKSENICYNILAAGLNYDVLIYFVLITQGCIAVSTQRIR